MKRTLSSSAGRVAFMAMPSITITITIVPCQRERREINWKRQKIIARTVKKDEGPGTSTVFVKKGLLENCGSL
jgi:hypothetical protein